MLYMLYIELVIILIHTVNALRKVDDIVPFLYFL